MHPHLPTRFARGSPPPPSRGRRAGALVLAACALALAACDREKREYQPPQAAESGPGYVATSSLQPGTPQPDAADPRGKMYEGNAFHISQGERLYTWFNCVGCHLHGGGGIGPALMDDEWRYGGSIDQIWATIDQGRPNGMPAFHGKIPPAQIWELAAYVRSLSSNVPGSANSSRGEEMSTTRSPAMQKPQPPKGADPAAVAVTPR